MIQAGKENPFPDRYSGYGRVVEGVFTSAYPEGSPMKAFHVRSHEQFLKFVHQPTFPCVLVWPQSILDNIFSEHIRT